MISFVKHVLLVFVLVWCLAAFDTSLWGQKSDEAATIKVVGRGMIYRGDASKAREHAIRDALCAAVEQAVGRLISWPLVVADFQLLSDRVYDQSSEFIHDYKVIGESKSGRYYRVAVKATVLIGAIRDRLQEIGVLAIRGRMPRIMFFVSEQNVDDIFPQYWWRKGPFLSSASVTEDSLSKYMRAKGFVVVDPSESMEDVKIGLECSKPELSNEEALKLGRQFGVDVIVVGKAVARRSGNLLPSNRKSVQAVVSVHAIRTDNGMVIGSSQKSRAIFHSGERGVGADALGLAASDVAEDLTGQIIANWNGQTNRSNLVQLFVKGIKEYADFVRFRTTLRNDVRGVKNVYLRAIKAGEARMDAEVRGDASTLADDLMAQRFEGFRINILEIGQNEIKLELMEKQNHM